MLIVGNLVKDGEVIFEDRLNFRILPFFLPMSVEDEKVLFHEISRIIRIGRISNRAHEIVQCVLLFSAYSGVQ